MTDEFRPWTDERAAELRMAARAAAEAILEHADALTSDVAARGHGRLADANEQLRAHLIRYSDSQFGYTGDPGPLGSVTIEDPEPESDVILSEPAVDGFAVLQRRDYEVTDLDAVIAAGREAYREVWPYDTQADAEAHVVGLGNALYQVAHARRSWEALDALDGLRASAAVTLVIPVGEILGADPESWPADPLDLDHETSLYTTSDVYFDEG